MSRREESLLEWCVNELSAAPIMVRAADWWSALQTVLQQHGATPNHRNMVYKTLSESMVLVEDVVARRKFVIQHAPRRTPVDVPEPRRFLAVSALRDDTDSGEWVVERTRARRRRSRAPVQGGVVFDALYA